MATEDEAQLKQRARWRLIGAVALALVAFVALPLLFDPAPKPLGSDVVISIETAPQPLPPSDPVAAQPAEEAVATQPAPPVPAPARPAPKPVEKPIAKPADEPAAAEKPAPKPAPKPEPVEEGKLLGESGYYLQLGVFSKADNARALADKVRALGYKVTITPVGSLHRVRVVGFNGGEKGREQALAAKQALKQKGISADLHGS